MSKYISNVVNFQEYKDKKKKQLELDREELLQLIKENKTAEDTTKMTFEEKVIYDCLKIANLDSEYNYKEHDTPSIDRVKLAHFTVRVVGR